MTYEQIKQAELTEAAARLAKAIKAQSAPREAWTIVDKGKTLISVNRTRAHLVALTVGY